MKYLVGVSLLLAIVGGYWWGWTAHAKSGLVWNLWDDPRGCIISWDDGTYSYKGRQINLGTIQPGESREIEVDFDIKEKEFFMKSAAIRLAGDSNRFTIKDCVFVDSNDPNEVKKQ